MAVECYHKTLTVRLNKVSDEAGSFLQYTGRVVTFAGDPHGIPRDQFSDPHAGSRISTQIISTTVPRGHSSSANHFIIFLYK